MKNINDHKEVASIEFCKFLKNVDFSKGSHLNIGGEFQEFENMYLQFFDGKYLQITSDEVNNLMSNSKIGFLDNLKYLSEYLYDFVNSNHVTSISFVDGIERLFFVEDFVKCLSIVTADRNIPILTLVPNFTHNDIVFKLFAGEIHYTSNDGLLSRKNSRLFNSDSLNKLFLDNSFICFENFDLRKDSSDQHFPSENTLLETETLIHHYFQSLREQFDPFYNVTHFIRIFVPNGVRKVEHNIDKNRPFLTVIIRTQGKRLSALNEAFLCLASQTCDDFNVILVCHNVNKVLRRKINNLVEDQLDALKSKIRVIYVDHGNRTTPLKIGFDNAEGYYVSVFDDDDLVFENWIEEFKKGYEKKPGTILHSYILKQNWSMYEKDGETFMTTIDAPDKVYCQNFDWNEQFRLNKCPIHSLAFPIYAYKNLGIKFDSTLTTTEDWDFLMRMAAICGVSDIEVATGIYRIWIDASNSSKIHTQKEWDSNYSYILNKLSKSFKLLPGEVKFEHNIATAQHENQKSIEDLFYKELENSKLYIDSGSDFNEGESLVGLCDSSNKKFSISYFIPKNYLELGRVRWDPTESESIILKDLSIVVYYENNDEGYVIPIEKIITNGNIHEKSIFFGSNDPMIIFNLIRKKDIYKIVITGEYSRDLSDAFMTLFGLPTKRSIFKRIQSKIVRK